MNRLEIKLHTNIYGCKEYTCFIDGISVQELFNKIISGSVAKHKEYLGNVLGLTFAWTTDLDWKGDIEFVFNLLKINSPILPILLCEDDLDFSCIVIVVEVERFADTVAWKRIGYVDHSNESFEEEKKNGILNTSSYSKEDWLKHGDSIALEKVDSPKWQKWISDNWDDELFRRRMNYTLPYYKTEGNIVWVKDSDWQFDKNQYERCVSDYMQMIWKTVREPKMSWIEITE